MIKVTLNTNGTEIWIKNGKFHKTNGTAFIRPDGTEVWYKDDIFHRIGGPSIIHADGTEFWYLNGKKQ